MDDPRHKLVVRQLWGGPAAGRMLSMPESQMTLRIPVMLFGVEWQESYHYHRSLDMMLHEDEYPVEARRANQCLKPWQSQEP